MTFIAIDMDWQSVRVAVAEKRPAGRAVVVAAVQLPAESDRGQLAARLRAALPGVRWSRAKLIVAVGGHQATLRLLKLPPTPDAELPAMVALLAEREFGAGGDAVVDHLPLSGDADSPRTVLAVRVPQPTVDAAADLAGALGATLAGVTLRGCGAASAATRVDASVREGGLLVAAAAGDSSDLVVLHAGLPVVVRTAAHVVTDGSSSEVRRTLSAAALQQGRGIARVVIVGTDVTLAELGERVATPLDTVAGAAGAALDAADGRPPEFDLLNPRRGEAAASPRRRQALVAALAVALVVGILGHAYWRLAAYDAELGRLAAERQSLEARTERLNPIAARAAAVNAWLQTDINWLDEFEQLARDFRPQELSAEGFAAADDAMLTKVTAATLGGRAGVGGQLALEALARRADTPTSVEQRVRDGRREVQQGPLDRSGRRLYAWRFKPTIRILAPLPLPPQADETGGPEASPAPDAAGAPAEAAP